MNAKSGPKRPSKQQSKAPPDRRGAKRQIILLSLFIGLLLLAGIGVGMLPKGQEAMMLGGLASIVALVIAWMSVTNLRGAFHMFRDRNYVGGLAFISVAAIQALLVIIILAQIFG